MNCTQFPLRPEKVIAVARDTYLTPRLAFPDPANLPGADAPKYGQDITSSYGRTAPKGQSVGSSPAELIPKMRKQLQHQHGFAPLVTRAIVDKAYEAPAK